LQCNEVAFFFCAALRCNAAKKATTAMLSLPSSYFFIDVALQRNEVAFIFIFSCCRVAMQRNRLVFFSCCVALQRCNALKKATTATVSSPSSSFFLAATLQIKATAAVVAFVLWFCCAAVQQKKTPSSSSFAM